jgi:glucose/arabinose dehydrogenase/mono/diheme cytochrome c family protein
MPRRWPRLHPALGLLLLALPLSPAALAQGRAKPPEQAPVEPDDLRPGLVARYRSLADPGATLDRLDAKPAFRLGHSSPHPRLPPGPFAVDWSGVLYVKDPGPITFAAAVCGDMRIDLDGVTVLQGRGETETAQVGPGQPFDRPPGLYRLRITYRSLPERPARLQTAWQGPTFSREPLPAWHLKYPAAELPPAVAQEQLAENGRAAAGRLGCARCHRSAFPGLDDPPPGPALSDLDRRIKRAWLLDWLADPSRVRPDAHMPALFAADRTGFVERWVLTDYLLGPSTDKAPATERAGDHRMGRRHFVGLGCAACHFLPDADRAEQPAFSRTPLTGLADRLPPGELAAFLANPHGRYPDGRMPQLPIAPETARDLAAYLLLWSKPTRAEPPAVPPPTPDEINVVSRRLRVRGVAATAAALLAEKHCAACHPGLGQTLPADVPLTDDRRGCLSGRSLPRFTVDAPRRQALAAYRSVAAREKYPSAFASRQRLLEHHGCVRCHQRDSDLPPPLEAVGSTLGGAWLQEVPFQRTPRLTYPHEKYTRSHLVAAVREGITGLRPGGYTYRMPAFGELAETLVQALAEGDGELPDAPDPAPRPPADPTLGPLAGPSLAGFQGYACVSCHIWNGHALADREPGSIGTDLTRVPQRIRRDWFDRYLDGPDRAHPGTPMPAIFSKGKPASLRSVLDGDPARQKDALWSYFALGKDAPSPKPPPPLAIDTPRVGEPPLVAQIPVRLPDETVLESLCVLYGSHDLFVYDLGTMMLHGGYIGAQLLRGVQGRLRTFTVAGTPMPGSFRAPEKPEAPPQRTFLSYDRLSDGVRIRFASGNMEIAETLRLRSEEGKRWLLREMHTASEKNATRYELPAAAAPQAVARTVLPDPGKPEGSLERPGYRAIVYPRPKTASGEDRVMPGALAVNPRDGRVFVASMKTGELFVLRDPTGDGKAARFDDYAHGLFQEAFAMLAEPDALYVLHRRNLTRLTEHDGVADRFDRVAALPHGIADTYDYGYGLVRDRGGVFVFTYAPYANTKLPGSGGALRLVPGQPPREVAYGFRNPLGWCRGPDGDIFFTDNQGEWVATNKLCHLAEGRFYGFPNPAQRQHATKPPGKTAVWIPYGWAKSVNGVTYDDTGGKFGPFAGQFFLAELMFGGAIVRASVEKVNGEWQGACFPFWGRGLLGPLTLAFDPKGRLFVGGITEPGWMAQPDRGALFRIDYTGQVPFEMQTIQVQPRGFRIVFTTPVSPETARDVAAYQVEHYRYEYTGAYGSPELDRTRVTVERAEVASDGRSVDLITGSLVKDRVYLIQARGVRSVKAESLVHPVGAYTLNEMPPERP